MKKVSVCLIAIFLFFSYLHVVLASNLGLPDVSEGQVQEAEGKIVPVRFLPGEPLYFAILTKEFVNRIFQPSSAKRSQFDLVLSGKRLKEAYLLVLKGKTNEANDTLNRYSQQIGKMTDNLQKARSQNQEVGPIVDSMAQDMQNHEILFSAIYKKTKGTKNADNLQPALSNALKSFVKAVFVINTIKPGVKDRFKTATSSAQLKKEVPVDQSDTDTPLFSPQAKPRRIIY
jgi:hypothetical protein